METGDDAQSLPTLSTQYLFFLTPLKKVASYPFPMMVHFRVSAFLVMSFLCSSLASPIVHAALLERAAYNPITRDGPGILSQGQLDAVQLVCPYGIQTGPNAKNILLIPGTATIGHAAYEQNLAVSFRAKGYSSCWTEFPQLSLGDAQITSEYVVNLINQLYARSGNTPIFLVGHSQGNLNIQWALNFFPSTRLKVASFVALAAPFQGTSMGPMITTLQSWFMGGSAPAVLQQSSSFFRGQSNFIRALNKHGNKALVPTTSIYSRQDEIVQMASTATRLGGGGDPFLHVAIQDVCPRMFVQHAFLLINRVSFYMALDAFENKSSADIGRVQRNYPDICSNNIAPGILSTASARAAELTMQAFYRIGSADGISLRTRTEPALVPYAAWQP